MKLYFPTSDADRCYNRIYFDMLMEEMGVEEMKVWPAKADIGGPGFFCAEHDEVWERGSGCEDCPEYEARNGRNGICKHWRHCRVPAETPVTLKKKV